MTESTEQQSTWRTKLKALGPGILMASAAVGGSHIVSSTQAGAIYGWQLALLIILINIFKYPFFRFGSQYTMENNKSLIEGYAEKGKGWLAVFFILNVFSAIVNTAGVGILCAAILYNVFPNGFGLSISQLTTVIIVIIWAMLLIGGYRFLDSLAKWVMTALTIATVLAVVVALFKHREYAPNFETVNMSEDDAVFDFNTGYVGTAILALIFCALGALIQFGSGEEVQGASAAYIAQFVNMYAEVLGEWARFLITLIAFLCIFGTVITVIDGYSRANNESLRLLLGKKESSQKALYAWMTVTAAVGLVIVYLFAGNVATMLRFAMIASFITTPFFGYLNYSLVNNKEHQIKPWLKVLSIIGLIYLFGFALFFIIAWLTGNI